MLPAHRGASTRRDAAIQGCIRMTCTPLGTVRGLCLSALVVAISSLAPAIADDLQPPEPVVQKITASNTKLEMTVNSSRILTMEQPIPQVQVGNPDLIDFTALSETQVQLHAKKPGLTSVNL